MLPGTVRFRKTFNASYEDHPSIFKRLYDWKPMKPSLKSTKHPSCLVFSELKKWKLRKWSNTFLIDHEQMLCFVLDFYYWLWFCQYLMGQFFGTFLFGHFDHKSEWSKLFQIRYHLFCTSESLRSSFVYSDFSADLFF